MQLFCLHQDDLELANELAQELNEPLAPLETRQFEDRECKLRPLLDPAGANAVVLCSLHGAAEDSPHDKLVRLLMFIATLRDHGAAHVTAVLPYLMYTRKDRRTQPFDPLGSRYIAQLFEAMGTQRVVVLEAHNLAALQNAFRIPSAHIAVHTVFDTLLPELQHEPKLLLASPDPGGVKRAQLWREHLESKLQRNLDFAWVDKRRSQGLISGGLVVGGDLQDATVLVVDDLISSGATMRQAAVGLRAAGARKVLACAAHGLFSGAASELLSDPVIDQLIVSNSVLDWRRRPRPVRNQACLNKLRVLSAAPALARCLMAGPG